MDANVCPKGLELCYILLHGVAESFSQAQFCTAFLHLLLYLSLGEAWVRKTDWGGSGSSVADCRWRKDPVFRKEGTVNRFARGSAL